MSREDWESDAQLFLKAGAGLSQVEWVNVKGDVIWSVQPGTAPNVKRQPAEPELATVVEMAGKAGGLTLSEVFDRDDRRVFYACTPVQRGGRLAGYIAGLYNASDLADSVLRDQLPHDYEVVIRANDRAIRALGSRNPGRWLEGARTIAIPIANQTWSAQLVPSAGDIERVRRIVLGFGALVSVLLFLCALLAMVYRRGEIRLRSVNAALASSQATFQRLLESDVIGVVVCNGERVINANDYFLKMMGYTREDLAAGEIRCAAFGCVAPPAGSPADQPSFPPFEGEWTTKAGNRIPVLAGGALLQPGVNRSCISVALDLTRKRELEFRLSRAEKYRSLALMAGGIAHDFNNLLTAIIGYAVLAEREVPKESPAGASIGSCLAAANRAAELVSQLLAYTGQAWYDAKPVNLSAVIEDMEPEIRDITPVAIEIRYDLAGDLPPIRAGVPELQQVIRNLVANAGEAIGEAPGQIEICTSRRTLGADDLAVTYPDQELAPGTYVRLEITDSGRGLPGEVVARAFDPFFTTKFVGRGLGLSTVHGIMRAHGGAVRFDPSVRSGARVEAIFPAMDNGRTGRNATRAHHPARWAM